MSNDTYWEEKIIIKFDEPGDSVGFKIDFSRLLNDMRLKGVKFDCAISSEMHADPYRHKAVSRNKGTEIIRV